MFKFLPCLAGQLAGWPAIQPPDWLLDEHDLLHSFIIMLFLGITKKGEKEKKRKKKSHFLFELCRLKTEEEQKSVTNQTFVDLLIHMHSAKFTYILIYSCVYTFTQVKT